MEPDPRKGLLWTFRRTPGEVGASGTVRGNPFPIEQELHPPATATELAVRDRAETETLLHRHGSRDTAILDRSELGVVMGTEILIGRLRAK